MKPVKALTGAERNKRPAAEAGKAHFLKCKTVNAAGKPFWGPWGAPDEYQYGGNSKFVLPTGSIRDSGWVQDISWKGRVAHEESIAKNKKMAMKDGDDAPAIEKMREFLRYRGESSDPWESINSTHGLPYATPARCVRPPTGEASTKWLLNVQGPMRETLQQVSALCPPRGGLESSRSRSSAGMAPPRRAQRSRSSQLAPLTVPQPRRSSAQERKVCCYVPPHTHGY